MPTRLKNKTANPYMASSGKVKKKTEEMIRAYIYEKPMKEIIKKGSVKIPAASKLIKHVDDRISEFELQKWRVHQFGNRETQVGKKRVDEFYDEVFEITLKRLKRRRYKIPQSITRENFRSIYWDKKFAATRAIICSTVALKKSLVIYGMTKKEALSQAHRLTANSFIKGMLLTGALNRDTNDILIRYGRRHICHEFYLKYCPKVPKCYWSDRLKKYHTAMENRDAIEYVKKVNKTLKAIKEGQYSY